MKQVLIHCMGNPCRAQMAEGIWNFLGQGDWQAHSVCSTPADKVHHQAVCAMKEIGINISGYRGRSFADFRNMVFDLMVSIGDNAFESYAAFPEARLHLQWSIEDPSSQGTDLEKMIKFRTVREDLYDRIKKLLGKRRPAVLFIGAHNSCRSQMAEAILRKIAGDRFDILSAGTRPIKIHRSTFEVMNEIGIDISTQRSKSVSEYLGQIPIDYPILVCQKQERFCPSVWPFYPSTMFWPFDDPRVPYGNVNVMGRFRRVRDQIHEKICNWLTEFDRGLRPREFADLAKLGVLKYSLGKV